MHRLLLVCLLLVGCAAKEVPLPAVQPTPEPDLTAYQEPASYVPPPVATDAPAVPPKPPAANEVRYAWEDGRADLVQVGIGYPTVVRFEAGEKLGEIMDGDRAYVVDGEEGPQPAQEKKHPNCSYGPRWEYCRGKSEGLYTPIEHVVFTGTHARGAAEKQGVVVFTDRRTYYLELQAVHKTKTRIVSWSYPPPPPQPPKPKEATLFPDLAESRVYHVGYTFTIPHDTPDWTPVRVWSDLPTQRAAKMYLQFGPALLHQRFPLIRGMDHRGKPYVLNARKFGTWVVIDELAPRLEIRRGVEDEAQVVVVTRNQLYPIQCPGEADCPVFPEAR